MKRLLNALLLHVGILLTIPTASQIITPSPFNSGVKVNFTRTWSAVAPISHPDTMLARPPKDVFQVTDYSDGLGRPLQTVIRKGSLITGDTARDAVGIQLYDEYGRQTYQYLPFVANGTGGNTSISDGFFKLNPFQQDSTFNKGLFPDETYYYRKNEYEASPLSRLTKEMRPGNNWVGTSKGVEMKYWFNKVADSVRVWNVTDVANEFGTYSTTSIYPAGTLYKRLTIDEHGKQVVEFINKEGFLILRKVQLSSTTDTGNGTNHVGWMNTYFIYDELNDLRCVIQPKGVEMLAPAWTFTSTILAELCFRYEYDTRGRMIMKKVPGSGAIQMVYDARSRLVMTQDSLLRAAHKWMYSLYDSLNRVVITGLITDNTNYNNPGYHRSEAAAEIVYPDLGSYTNEEMTRTFYDDYTWRGSEGNPLSGTRNTTFDSHFQTASNSIWPYPQNVNQSTSIKGLVTGFKAKVVGISNAYLYSVFFYDEKARPIQSQNMNITGGTDIISAQYGFATQPLNIVVNSEKAGNNSQTTTVVTKYTYDDLMRMTKIEKKIANTKVSNGTMPSTWKTIFQNEYDALGRMKMRKLGDNLDSLKPDYNIQGWFLGINRSYVKDTSSVSNYFGFDLGYDKANFLVNGTSKSYVRAQYSGNIAGMLWKSTGDDQLRKYDFVYDSAYRLVEADFNQLTNNSFSRSAGLDYSISGLSYDANGNLLTMNQRGWEIGGSKTIDSLIYTYLEGSNKLKNVIDRKNDSITVLGDFRSSGSYMSALGQNKTSAATDFSYDANGNYLTDNNKDITHIRYNHLGLPDSIAVAGKGNIKYVYNAGGYKLKKIVTDGELVSTTVYLFGIYINDSLQYIQHEGGRIRRNDSISFEYDYFVKDHLENVRVILTDQKDTAFYPPASMETGEAVNENLYYSGIEETRVELPHHYPTDSYTTPNDYVARVNKDDNPVGPAITLKVMAGDKFNVRVSSYWDSPTDPPPFSTSNISGQVLGSLSTGVENVPGSKYTSAQLSSSGVLTNIVSAFLGTQNSGADEYRPISFVNWILFDEQFNFVSSSSGFDQVGEEGRFTVHTFNNLPIHKNGYLYVYVSNASSEVDVFFDNLQITHIKGPLVEESHYYPFGLTMHGISSKAVGSIQNRYKFNGSSELANKEFGDGSGLEIYETLFRGYDPQIGRFHQIDALAESLAGISPYAFCLNNPILYSDPLGLDTTVNGKHCPDSKTMDELVLKPAKYKVSTLRTSPTPVAIGKPTRKKVDAGLTLMGAAFSVSTRKPVGAAAAVIVRHPQLAAAGLGAAVIIGIGISMGNENVGVGAPPPMGFTIQDATYRPAMVHEPLDLATDVPLAPPISIPLQPEPPKLSSQYTLRALNDGWYPGYMWGLGLNYSAYLKRGDIWKIGESEHGPKRSGYSKDFMANTGQGLFYVHEFGPAPVEMTRFVQNMKIINYQVQHNGMFPPGNTKRQ